MNSKNQRGGSLVVQAGVLAAAGILVRILGLLYNTPLVKIIGDEGFGYYDSAYVAYSIVLLVSSYSIPAAISKVMAQKLAKNEYRNAHRIFKCALIYVCVVGFAASLFVFLGAGILVKMPNAILPLKILAPTIFFSGILGVFRGFFQAQHSMVQTSVSQIIEQIFNAIFSVWMAYVLVRAAQGMSVSTIASYGAAGSTIGTGAGVLSALLFMLLLYFVNRKGILRKVSKDTTPHVDSYASIFKMILMVVTPFILSTCVYNVNSFLDKTIYQIVMMDAKKVEEALVAFDLSAYAKANKIANIPIAMASAMATTLIPRISSAIAKEDFDSARKQVSSAIKITMFISIPAAIGMGCLAKPVMMVIFPQKDSLSMSSAMLIVLSLTVVLYGLSTITQAVLQSVGKMSLPIINALIALVIHDILMILFMQLLPVNLAVYVYGVSTILYSLILCILNGVSVRHHLQYEQEIDKTFLRPFLSSLVMGVVVLGIYYGTYALFKTNIVSMLLAVIVGVIVYFVMSIKWKTLQESEIRALPKGHVILKIAKKFKLL